MGADNSCSWNMVYRRNKESLVGSIRSLLGGGSRPNARFQALCALVGVAPRTNIETGRPEAWHLKDLRKTCATYYDAHVPESSIEILGHSVSGVTFRHYEHRAPLAFRAIMTLLQPSANGPRPWIRRSMSMLPASVHRRYSAGELTECAVNLLRSHRPMRAATWAYVSSPICVDEVAR